MRKSDTMLHLLNVKEELSWLINRECVLSSGFRFNARWTIAHRLAQGVGKSSIYPTRDCGSRGAERFIPDSK